MSGTDFRSLVPLFWSQQGYGLKPAPALSPERSHPQNLDALGRHLQRLTPRYGPLVSIRITYICASLTVSASQTVINLAEQQGKEGAVTAAYRNGVHELALKDVQ